MSARRVLSARPRKKATEYAPHHAGSQWVADGKEEKLARLNRIMGPGANALAIASDSSFDAPETYGGFQPGAKRTM
eukprot:1759675-Prymnesium_polylepis.1